MRRPIYFLTAVLCLSAFASADLKIKARTTVMGHSTDSTVYIKDGRQRSETSYGGHAGAVTIMQCDQKRMITVAGNQCMVMPMGGGSCPSMNMGAMARKMMGQKQEEPETGGGVVTVTRNSTDTGERQDMFGYKARHIKTSMTMAPSPDACNQSNMKMEMDGWYADIAGFTCEDSSYQAMACGVGAQGGCHDRIVMKGSGGTGLGYPLKQTITITSPQGTFTTTTEVIELTNTLLEDSLFDMPPGCRVMDMTAMMGGASGGDESEPSPAPEKAAAPAAQPAAPAAPAPAPAPAVALKGPGSDSHWRGQNQGRERRVAAHRQYPDGPAERTRPQTARRDRAGGRSTCRFD